MAVFLRLGGFFPGLERLAAGRGLCWGRNVRNVVLHVSEDGSRGPGAEEAAVLPPLSQTREGFPPDWRSEGSR